jgi:hypothetical protein
MKQNKIMAEFEQCGFLLSKSIMMVDINSQWKYQIKTINDKQINDVVVETHNSYFAVWSRFSICNYSKLINTH